MKVLLSPAKKLDLTKTLNYSEGTQPLFMDEAQALVKKMSKFSAKKIGGMMHLSKDLSELNYERYQTWESVTELNGKNAFAAAAFDGEVYRGLDAPSMSEEHILRAQDQVRILSGLYGILKPLDVIYPYRLEMGTKWAVTPAKTNLYKYWGTKIADLLNEDGDEEIVNLASNEYFKAVDRKTLKARVITPSFKDFKNGEYKTIMVFAKKARGFMARYIVDNKLEKAEDIKNFDTEGYRFDENLSTENDWVFTR